MFKLVKLLVMVCCFVAISGLNLAVSFAQNPNFNQVLYWDNYSFSIKEDGDKLIIKPKNLAIVNRKEVHDIVGYTVNDVQIADLNDDGYPEVLVYLTNDGSGSYGNLIGYSSNNGNYSVEGKLIEALIIQHDEINKLYPYAVNTLRVFSYYGHIIGSVLLNAYHLYHSPNLYKYKS